MKLKLDENGNVVVVDGKPVYTHDDGKDVPFDAPGAVASITRLNGEAKVSRTQIDELTGKTKAFEGIEDPEAARKALETVANLGAGDLVKAADVQKIKDEARIAAEKQVADAHKGYDVKVADLDGKNKALETELFNEKVGGAFSRSKFISDKTAVPPDMLQAMFGQRFKIEGGKVVGLGADKAPIYSKHKPGEIAEFDEALEAMIDSYPNRDNVLKGSGKAGDGAGHDNGGGGGGGKTMKRAQFTQLDTFGRQKAMKENIQIVD